MKKAKKIWLSKGCSISKGSDGHWFNFEINGKYACINIENKFNRDTMTDRVVIEWARSMFKGECDE